MIKKIFVFCAFILCVQVPSLLFAAEQEQVSQFNSIVTIRDDRSIDVVETITYDFGQNERHGIFRYIPYRFIGQPFELVPRTTPITFHTVTNEFGTPYRFISNYSGGEAEIKIGDPEKTVTGSHTYQISYTLENVINFFEAHDELFLNVVGSGWEVPVVESSISIIYPRAIPLQTVQTACYTGSVGSQIPCAEKQSIVEGGEEVGVLFTHSNLLPFEDFSVVVGLPKGIIQTQAIIDKLYTRLLPYGVMVGLPVLVAGVMLYLWYTKGRDPKGRGTIITQFDAPKGLQPIEVGTIVDNTVHPRDISAQIIELAITGYLTIERVATKRGKTEDYILRRISSDMPHNKISALLIDGLFKKGDEVQLKELEYIFYTTWQKIKSESYTRLVKDGYTVRHPWVVRVICIILGIVFVIPGIVIAALGFGLAYFIGLFFSGLFIGVIGWFLPARTQKGVEVREHILGLKQYLSVAEKDRIEFHNAPEKSPKLFEKLLPLAMVLGVEKQWAKQFEGLYITQPSWYTGSSAQLFSASLFTSDLASFSSFSSQTLAATQSSSGSSGLSGGSSGGGFGGGGGGSW